MTIEHGRSTYIFERDYFLKSAIFNSVKHADLTRSHRHRKNEPFQTSIAHIQVKLLLIAKIWGCSNCISPKS